MIPNSARETSSGSTRTGITSLSEPVPVCYNALTQRWAAWDGLRARTSAFLPVASRALGFFSAPFKYLPPPAPTSETFPHVVIG